MFTVDWTTQARNLMLALLLRSANKQQMLRAGRTIENLLRRAPYDVGESRGQFDRVLFERPLFVIYTINDDERIVRIEYVRWVGF